MNSFKIGNTEFGIGNVSFSIENNLLNLEIEANEDIFNELTEQDDCEWSWALYPPRIYFHGVPCTPFKENVIMVDENYLNHYDIALYMMEHNDFIGTLKVTDNSIDICGKVYIDGSILTLTISVDRKNL